jgi:hypothetical protein
VKLRKQSGEGLFFLRRADLGKRPGGRLLGKAAGGKLSLDAVPAVASLPGPDDRARGGEVVEPPLALETLDRLASGRRGESPLLERPDELFAPSRPRG